MNLLPPFAAALLAVILPPSVLGGNVYYMESGYHLTDGQDSTVRSGDYIRRLMVAPIEGGAKPSVVYSESVNALTTGFFYGLTLDPTHKVAYFCDKLEGTVKSIDIATGKLSVVIEGMHGVSDLAINFATGQVYAAGGDSCVIWSATLYAGATPRPLWRAQNCTIYDSITPKGIALDVDNGAIYFTDPFKQHIMTVPMTGGAATIVDTPKYYGSPQIIRLELTTRTMYMTDEDLGVVTAPMDGGAKWEYIADLGQIYGLALDTKSGNVWFSNHYLDYVGFEPMQGGDATQGNVVFKNTSSVYTIALDV